MRRFIIGICLLLCTGLWGGCQRTPTAITPPVTTGFSCRVTANYNGMAVEGQMVRHLADDLTLTLTKPDTLNGLTLTLDGNTLTAAWHGVTATVDPAQLPQAGALPLLLHTLDAAATLTDGGERTADGLKFTGETDLGSYTLLSDPETGNLLTLEIPAAELTVTFSDFQRLTDESGK